MIEAIGRRLRGAVEKLAKLSFAEWLLIALAVLAVGTAVYTGAVELTRQARSREMLTQLKAARLAASAVSAERYGKGQPFADFTAEDGFAGGAAAEICELGALPGAVRLLQTDDTGYEVQALAYLEDGYIAIYDADESWQVYCADARITHLIGAG